MKAIVKTLYIKAVIVPIAKDFWARLDAAEAMLNGTLDGLCEYEEAMESIRKDFNALPENIRNYIGNSKKSMLVDC